MQVLFDVVQNGIQTDLEEIPVQLWPKQNFGPVDQGVDMGFLVPALGFVGRDVFQHQLVWTPVFKPRILVDSPSDVTNIFTAISIARERRRLAACFQVPQPNTGGEYVHLPPGIVDIIFAAHIKPHRRQQIGDHRTIGGAPAMSDMKGTCGVGGDEFYLDFFTQADLA